jgi:hypothetical protein
MATDYEQMIEEEIPGNVYVFSVVDDEEHEHMPAVISHVDEYELPDHFVRERKAGGGVCAYALLRALGSMNPQDGARKKKLTWAEALETMHAEIEEEGGRGSLPTLSTSRPIDVREEHLRLISTSKRGVKRALLIATHYQDEEDENVWLESCHTDVRGIRNHLIHEEGFEKENILVMMDDDRHHEPTKNFILDALERMCQISEAGDSIFFHFSGEYKTNGVVLVLVLLRRPKKTGLVEKIRTDAWSIYSDTSICHTLCLLRLQMRKNLVEISRNVELRPRRNVGERRRIQRGRDYARIVGSRRLS